MHIVDSTNNIHINHIECNYKLTKDISLDLLDMIDEMVVEDLDVDVEVGNIDIDEISSMIDLNMLNDINETTFCKPP